MLVNIIRFLSSDAVFTFLSTIVRGALFFTIILNIYLVLDKFKNYRLDKSIKKGFYKLSEREKLAKFKFKQMEYYVSKKQKYAYLKKLQSIILKSNINERLKIITPEIVIILSTLTSIICFVIAYKKIDIFIPSILIAFAGYKIPALILNLLAEKESLNVNKRLVEFLNILINFCSIKNDIVYAISNSVPFLKKPLRNYCESFIYEVKHGVTPEEALENFKNKIDNKQFQVMIKNLQLCVIYSNKYKEVLEKSKALILKYNKEHANRKKEARIARNNLLLIIVVGSILFKLLVVLNPNLWNILQTTFEGKVLITYMISVFIFAFQVSIKVSKFEY